MEKNMENEMEIGFIWWLSPRQTERGVLACSITTRAFESPPLVHHRRQMADQTVAVDACTGEGHSLDEH